MSKAKKRKSKPKGKVLKPVAVLRRLKVGELISVGDWCCNPHTEPVRVAVGEGIRITENHWPHYRIEYAA